LAALILADPPDERCFPGEIPFTVWTNLRSTRYVISISRTGPSRSSFTQELNININDPIYARSGGSKGNAFVETVDKPTVVRTLNAMLWNGFARSAPEGDDGGERDRRGVAAGELVVAGGDVAEVLQMAKHGLNTPTLAAAPPVVTDAA
jgi:hypothetical protein